MAELPNDKHKRVMARLDEIAAARAEGERAGRAAAFASAKGICKTAIGSAVLSDAKRAAQIILSGIEDMERIAEKEAAAAIRARAEGERIEQDAA